LQLVEGADPAVAEADDRRMTQDVSSCHVTFAPADAPDVNAVAVGERRSVTSGPHAMAPNCDTARWIVMAVAALPAELVRASWTTPEFDAADQFTDTDLEVVNEEANISRRVVLVVEPSPALTGSPMVQVVAAPPVGPAITTAGLRADNVYVRRWSVAPVSVSVNASTVVPATA